MSENNVNDYCFHFSRVLIFQRVFSFCFSGGFEGLFCWGGGWKGNSRDLHLPSKTKELREKNSQ